MGDILTKLAKWVVFSVAITLAPILFNYVRLGMRTSETIGLESLIGRGELLLLTAGISAKAIGELFDAERKLRIAKYIVGGASILIVILASLTYVDVTSAYAINQPLPAGEVKEVSVFYFLCAFVAGASCAALTEVK